MLRHTLGFLDSGRSIHGQEADWQTSHLFFFRTRDIMRYIIILSEKVLGYPSQHIMTEARGSCVRLQAAENLI